MITFIQDSSFRPSRAIPSEQKDKDYHLKYARWAVSQAIYSTRYTAFLKNAYINWAFFSGRAGQWILEEDSGAFLNDEHGNSRDRIQMSMNMIKPIVNYFVGSASTMNFGLSVETMSDGVKSAMIDKLDKMMFMHEVVKKFPDLEGSIRRTNQIGKDEQEAIDLASLETEDELREAFQALLNAIQEYDTKPKEMRIRLARYLAIYGLGVNFCTEKGSRLKAYPIEPHKFMWDTSATLPDLSDASFMGHYELLDLPQILELSPGLNIDKENYERWATSRSQYSNTSYIWSRFNEDDRSIKMPVYFMRWRDYETDLFGYVRDATGMIVFARIGDEYTKKDLVKKDELTEGQLKRTNGGVISVDFEVIRRCTFIAHEDYPSSSNGGLDLILDYGIDKYNDKYISEPDDVKYPYKAYTWTMERGVVLTPIDDIIDPQRMVNRVASAHESHINNSHPPFTVINKESLDTNLGEEGTLSNISRGKAITVHANKVGGVNQAVAQIRSNLGDSSYSAEGIINSLKNSVNQMTGINEAMNGTANPGDMLVGVANELINRGSVLQEPMFHALTEILGDTGRHLINVGKRFYSDHPDRLAMMAGENYGLILSNISQMRMEDVRMVVERVQDGKNDKNAADELIMLLLQLQQIDAVLASSLMGRSSTNKVISEWKIFAKKMQMAQQQASEQAAQLQNEEKERGMQMAENEQQRADFETLSKQELEGKKIDTDYAKARERNASSIERDAMKLEGRK